MILISNEAMILTIIIILKWCWYPNDTDNINNNNHIRMMVHWGNQSSVISLSFMESAPKSAALKVKPLKCY